MISTHLHKTGSTIFKTYNNDLDGFINKIGFSKRSFVEFDEQVAQAFDNGTSKVNKFTNAIKAMFTVQKESQNEWETAYTGEIFTQDNIDKLMPEIDETRASEMLKQIQAIDKANDSWEEYFKGLKKGNNDCIVKLIQNTDDLSKLTGDDLVQANKQARQAALAHNAGLKTMTVGAKVAKVAVAALNATISMGVTLLISEAIEWVMKWANAEEEAAEKAKEEAEKAKEAKQKLREENKESAETAKEELNTIKDLISQYEQFKNITYLTTTQKETLKGIQDQLIETFGDEAEGIDLINGKYRENIELLKEEQRLKAQEAIRTQKVVVSDAVSDLYDTKGITISYSLEELDESEIEKQAAAILYKSYEQGRKGVTLTNDGFIIKGTESYVMEGYLSGLLQTLEQHGLTNSKTYKKLLNGLNHYQGEIDNYNQALDDLAQTYIDGFEPVPKNASKKEYEDWQKRLLAYVNDNNNVEYSYWTDENGTPYESLDYIASLGDNLLNEAIIKASEEYYQGNNSLVDEEAIEKSLNEYSTKISEFLSEKEKIDSAFKEQAENGSISEKTALDLIQSGYGNAIVNEAGSYKLLREEIDKTAKSRRAETKASLDSDKTKLQSIVDDELERLQKDIDDGNVDSAEAKQRRNEIEEIQDLIDKYNLYIPMLETADTVTSKYTESIEAENEALEKTAENLEKIDNAKSVIDKAIEEQNEFGRLSADSIKALHEAGLGTALAYNEATGETTLLIDSVHDLYDAMIEAQKEAEKISISNLDAEIEEIKNELSNLTINSVGDVQYKEKLESAIEDKEKQKGEHNKNLQLLDATQFDSDQKSAEDAHEEYINSIKEAFDKEKSELDHLLDMDAISQEDYFNKLHSLNEKYFKDKTDLLDEYRQYEEEVYKGLKQVQIDAIQEQIDALKSVNEEKQEEIDLEKAKLALENAKKNRNVRVYDSERGWIYETNRETIDSAQKEYDDLVLNEKVEELENVIKAIEEGRNTSHTLNESVNAVQQVDGMIDLTKYFTNLSDQEVQMIREVQNSVFRGIGANDVFSQQISNKMPSNSNYETVNNNLSLNLHDVTVVANNPEEFLSEMERVANESFKNNFPTAMNNFADGLNRYRMNHS